MQHKFLFAHPDLKSVEIDYGNLDRNKVEICGFHRPDKAQEQLIAEKRSFHGIFMYPFKESPGFMSLLNYAGRYQAGCPFYVIEGSKLPVEVHKEREKLGIKRIFDDDVPIAMLIEILHPDLLDVHYKNMLDGNLSAKDKLDEEIQDNASAFLPVSAASFLSGNKNIFDVYVQLKKDKFVKILQAGDDFDKQRVENYLNKGLQHFYIRQSNREEYLAYTQRLADKVASLEKLGRDVKSSFLMAQSETLVNFLINAGMSKPDYVYAKNTIASSHDFIKKNFKSDLIGDFLKNAKNLEHSSGVSFIAVLLAKKLEIDHVGVVEVLGTCALLHDIGLYRNLSDSLYSFEKDNRQYLDETMVENVASDPDKDEVNMQSVLKNHPKKGADIMTEMGKEFAVHAQVIMQHHERRDGTGYPNGLKSGQIHQMAEILGLSDELVKAIKRLDKNLDEVNDQDYELFMEFSKAFSAKTVNALKELLHQR